MRACNAAGCGGYSGSTLVQRVIHDAQIVGHAAPSQMISDQTATITVTVRNTGNVSWSAGDVYLGRNQSHYSMPAAGVPLTQSVAPGGTATFQYQYFAPRGAFLTQTFWFGGQMAANGVGFFGALVPVKSVIVENPNGYCSGSQCERPR